MSDLVEFLRARLDEDERNARDAEAQWADTHLTIDPGSLVLVDFLRRRHTPARVLREVEAKRKILALHYLETESYLDADGIERPGHHCWECDQRDWPCPTIRALAAVYSDHPDYQKDWA